MFGRRIPSKLVIAITVVAALVVPALWAVLAHSEPSVGDIALIELRSRDVLSRHPPLYGAYSRYGWAHPGPLIFYAYAIPYRLFGSDGDSLRIAALLVNTASLATLAWLLRRRGRSAFVVVLAATCALVWGLMPRALADSWNVTIDLLPFLVTIVACWCALCGDRHAWLAAALACSFTVQAHIGFGVVIAPLVIASGTWLAVRGRRADAPIRPRHVAVGAAAGLAIALPALYDVVAHWPGNLGHLAGWSLSNDEPTVGLGDALRMVGRSSSLSFPLHPRFPNQFILAIESVSVGFAPGALLVLLAAATAISVRRRWRDEAVLCGCLATVWFAGLVAAARVTRPLAFWLVEWLQPLAWLTWAAVALVAWRMVQPRVGRLLDRPRMRSAVAVVGAIVLGAGTAAYAHGLPPAGDFTYADAIDRLVSGARTVGRDQPIFFDYTGDPFTAGTVFLAVANELDQHGFEICVRPEYAIQFGQRRVCPGRGDVRLLIRDEPLATDTPDHGTVLAISDPLSPAERGEADGLTRRLADVLTRNGMADQVPLLYTPLAHLLLDRELPAEVAASRAEIERLDALRQHVGTRLGLYAITPA